MAPADPPPFQPDTNLLQGLTLATNGRQTRVTLTRRGRFASPGPRLRWQVVEADERLRAGLGTNRVALEYVAVGWGRPAPTDGDHESFRVPARFFHPDLTPFAPADWRRLKMAKQDRELSFREGAPVLVGELRFTGIKDCALLGLRVFDARTRAPVDIGGYSQDARGGGCRFECSVALWHDTPVELVLDLATGPARTFAFPPRPGVRQTFPDGMVELAAVVEGREQTRSIQSRNGWEIATLGFVRSGPKPAVSLLFLCQPTAHPSPFFLDALGPDGKALAGWGGSSSGLLKVRTWHASPADIARVRLRCLPRHYRLVFRLPRLPGLPEENRGVPNLLEVRVPFVRFRAHYQMRRWLEGVLQVKMTVAQPPTVPPGTFPMEFTDVTAGEVLDRYLKLLPPGTRLRFDAERSTLYLGPSRLSELIEWVKKLF